MKRDVRTVEVFKQKLKAEKFFRLEGTESLLEEELITTLREKWIRRLDTGWDYKKISEEVVSEEIERIAEFPLREVTVKELRSIRKEEKPGFVLKKDGKYYYGLISVKTRLTSYMDLREHLCAYDDVCRYLLAASDQDGGCAKVRNNSKYIENYNYITYGYETFNTEQDCFVVLNCHKYKKCLPSNKTYSDEEKEKMKLKLAGLVWDDFNGGIGEMRRRISKAMHS